MKKPSVPSRSGRSLHATAPRDPRCDARAPATTCSFSRLEMVHVEYTSAPPGRRSSIPVSRICVCCATTRIDRRPILTPTRVGAGGKRAEVGAGRVHEYAIVALLRAGELLSRFAGAGRVRSDNPHAAGIRAPRHPLDLTGTSRIKLDGNHLSLLTDLSGDRDRFYAGPSAQIEDPLPRRRAEHTNHRLSTPALGEHPTSPKSIDRRLAQRSAPDEGLGWVERSHLGRRRDWLTSCLQISSQRGGVTLERVDPHRGFGRLVHSGEERASALGAQLVPPQLRQPLRH